MFLLSTGTYDRISLGQCSVFLLLVDCLNEKGKHLK